MKFRIAILAILSFLLFTGCRETVTVVDAESGQPIEGAVILVEWLQTKGLPGLSYTESYKVVEAVTDKEGKAAVEIVGNPMVSAPRVTIYKKGYVAWNNEFIFPDWQKRKDFKWENTDVFKLEKFKPEYSYVKHLSFLRASIMSFSTGDKKKLMKSAYEWEVDKASQEEKNNFSK